MSEQPNYLLLGEILRPHGVKGELRMRILTAYPERIIQLEQVWLGRSPNASDAVAYTVEGMRRNGPYALLRLKGIDDRESADRLRELLVMVEMAHAVPLEEGEFYLFQLIGLTVRLVGGETLGKLTDVLETGANDVYVIQTERYGELLIPVLDHIILKTDIAAGEMIVDLPEGYLPNSVQE